MADDALVGLLREHRTVLVKSGGAVAGFECSCGTSSDHGWTPAGADKQARTHLAAVIEAHYAERRGAAPVRTEWGVVLDTRGTVELYDSREQAECMRTFADGTCPLVRVDTFEVDPGTDGWDREDDETGETHA